VYLFVNAINDFPLLSKQDKRKVIQKIPLHQETQNALQFAIKANPPYARFVYMQS
jgi:hypothetical protein